MGCLTTITGRRGGIPLSLVVGILVGAFLFASAPTALGFGFITKWGRHGKQVGRFGLPGAIATDRAGNVYVLDSRDRVEKFTKRGAFLMQWGSQGRGEGQFREGGEGGGIATDRAGNVYVSDVGNNRIEKFSSKGAFLTEWGHAGRGRGEFREPGAIATDRAGNVYVVDKGNNRIEKFSSKGAFLTQWGSQGVGLGQFIQPIGIATDGAGNVYVPDTASVLLGRVSKFTSSGSFLLSWTGPVPGGIATDRAGHVFISSRFNPEFGIKVYTSTGAFLSQFGGPGRASGQFTSPGGIAVDARGDLYIADSGNHRIQKFGEPSSAFSFDKKVRTDSQRGTAHLTVNLPGVGQLSVAGAQIRSAELKVNQAGRKTLLVIPSKKTQEQLETSGRSVVGVQVTYTPTTPGAALPSTQTKRVTLVKLPSLATATFDGASLHVRLACPANFEPLCLGRAVAVTARDHCERREGHRICRHGTPMTTAASVHQRPTESKVVKLRVKSEFRSEVAQMVKRPAGKRLLVRQLIHSKGFDHGRPRAVYHVYGVQAGM